MNLRVVISTSLNMYLPLGMESHPGTLFVATVPTQKGEVMSAQLQTSKHPPQRQQPHLLQRHFFFSYTMVMWFFQVITKNHTNLHNRGDSLPSRPRFDFLLVSCYFLKGWGQTWRVSQVQSKWVAFQSGTGWGSAKKGVAVVHWETEGLKDHLWIYKLNTNTVSLLCSANCIRGSLPNNYNPPKQMYIWGWLCVT